MRRLLLSLSLIRQVAWRHTLGALLMSLGALWAVVEATSYFAPLVVPKIQELWWAFLVLGVACGLHRGWPRLTVQCPIAGTDVLVRIAVGDLLCSEADIVLSSNTTFDTAVEDGTIDSGSLQGQFTVRHFASRVAHLDAALDRSLAGVEATEMSATDKPFGKKKVFPVGTVATVELPNRRAYFVAIAKLNAYRVASSSDENVLICLPALWDHIRTKGASAPLAIPVLGTGYSRGIQLTRNEMIREIARSFVAATLEGRFVPELTIVVSAGDVARGWANIQECADFLRYECKYSTGHRRGGGRPVGKALGGGPS